MSQKALQDAAQPLANARHELFAQAVADGNSDTDAYKEVYRVKPATARASGARLLANASVRARVEWLKAENAKIRAMSREEKRQLLADIARNAQSVSYSMDGEGRFNPDNRARIMAIAEDNRMTGDAADSNPQLPAIVINLGHLTK